MKFTKLTKKLLLSALSLGLAVVTLTTTTFAWYTSSTDATAGNGLASTSGQSSDSSLMISNNQTAWGPTANISETVTDLIPLQWNAEGKKFQVLGATNGVYASSGYYSFNLYFKTTGASSAVDVFLKSITITNTSDVKEYPTLASGEIPTGCPKTSYYVDVVQALDLSIGTLGSDAAVYDLSNTMLTYKPTTGFDGETPNAIAYYNHVMKTTLSGSDNVSTPLDHTKIGQIAAPTQETPEPILAVTFTIFLNGWDAYCFDVCRGQSFSVSLDFTTKTKGQA